MGADGEPGLVASDVTKVLGYLNGPQAVVAHVEDHLQIPIRIRDGQQNNPNKTVLSAGGRYALVMGSSPVLVPFNLSPDQKAEQWAHGPTVT
ncbi:BRO family protein [Prosthecomicrobium sp. N25]|uniref:BRO family protein n=1 Tax=Prosthecomicrobium sp. N25 TaxID=3129254 RepID=UPI003FCDC3EE